MNITECAELIKTLLGAYPNTKMDNPRGTIDSYMLVLGEYDVETVYKAARMYMMGKTNYFPNPGELLKLIPLAPFMFNGSEAAALPSGASEDADADDWNTGCEICPYADSCAKEVCIV